MSERTKVCWWCGEEFAARTFYQRYCSVNHRTSAWRAQRRYVTG